MNQDQLIEMLTKRVNEVEAENRKLRTDVDGIRESLFAIALKLDEQEMSK